jgi:hypothetical protein
MRHVYLATFPDYLVSNMKIYLMSVILAPPSGTSVVLANASDLSSFSFYQRKEFMTFLRSAKGQLLLLSASPIAFSFSLLYVTLPLYDAYFSFLNFLFTGSISEPVTIALAIYSQFKIELMTSKMSNKLT